MRKILMTIVLIVMGIILIGCDSRTISSDEAIKALEDYIQLKENASQEDSTQVVDTNLTSDTVQVADTASMENNTQVENVDIAKMREELNANAYDAKKLGSKTLIKEKNYKVDIVVGDDYFATQLADMMVNFDKFDGKVVEIEGFALKNGPYTFVGRYSENAICPTCPAGYAYYEFEWHGDEAIDLGDELNWIKVTGKLTKGNDGEEYYYIDTYRIDIMDKWGAVSTVSN